jgi:prepilin-type N-terminal cleavage/methylation domain-containing protein
MTMMRPSRPGVTLVEVMVTIFIMGLGMLALLTLFPVGALSIARALKDDRAANAAVNADGIGWAQNLRNDPQYTTSNGGATDYFTTSPAVTAGTGVSNGIFVDPLGVLGGVLPTTVGKYPAATGATSSGLQRKNMSLPNWTARGNTALTQDLANRWCTLLDDIQFQNNGTPDQSSGGVVRYGAYTWAWLFREEVAGLPDRGIHCWVVVYRNRVTSDANSEATFPVATVNTDNSLTITGTGLNLKTGSWILDTTPASNSAVPGYFYRVVDWYVDTAAGQTTLQLETAPVGTPTVITLMDTVVEVFDRGITPMYQ